jgi:hypothetical protein
MCVVEQGTAKKRSLAAACRNILLQRCSTTCTMPELRFYC